MQEVEKKIEGTLKKRDALFAKVDELNKLISSKLLDGTKLFKTIENRDKTFNELQTLLKEEIRPHVESLVFGSSIRPTEEDIFATEDANTERSKIKKGLMEEEVPSASGNLMQTGVPKGMTTGVDTATHAEQSLITTQRVLEEGIGITVHFPGDSMEVVAGSDQIHLWFDNAHFQAIIIPR